MNQLLAALGSNIKPAGRDKWSARCPVHQDKDFATSIKLNADNSVMAHCFACGANGLDIYNALGLELDELFGKERDPNEPPHHIKDQYSDDKWLVAIFEADVRNGRDISFADKKRYKVAKNRIIGIENKWGVM